MVIWDPSMVLIALAQMEIRPFAYTEPLMAVKLKLNLLNWAIVVEFTIKTLCNLVFNALWLGSAPSIVEWIQQVELRIGVLCREVNCFRWVIEIQSH